jgi:hypothetical protein
VLNEMRLRVTAAGHDLAGGETLQRLASGYLTVALRDPLGLLARGCAKKGRRRSRCGRRRHGRSDDGAAAVWAPYPERSCAARGSVCAR